MGRMNTWPFLRTRLSWWRMSAIIYIYILCIISVYGEGLVYSLYYYTHIYIYIYISDILVYMVENGIFLLLLRRHSGPYSSLHPCRLGSVSSDNSIDFKAHFPWHFPMFKWQEATQNYKHSHKHSHMANLRYQPSAQPQVRHGNVHGPPVHSHVFMVVARCPHRFAHDRLVRHGGFADHFTQEHDLATKMAASGHP